MYRLGFTRPRDTDRDGLYDRKGGTGRRSVDFPAFGKAYRNLSEDEYEQATSIAMERHLALNWLCGYDSDWDETPTDT